MTRALSDSVHNAILRLLALLLALWGLVQLVQGLDAGGAFGKMGGVLWGIFVIWTAVGFWRRRGWAFLVVSVGLLVSFLTGLIGLIRAIDAGEGAKAKAIALLATIVLIGYLGRWPMERRFRPHLDTAAHG
jgi:hypothetical protein